MDSTTFMGMLIRALVVLAGLLSTAVAIVVKPLLRLNTNLVTLDNSVKSLNESVTKVNRDVIDLKEEVGEHDRRLIRLEEHDRQKKA